MNSQEEQRLRARRSELLRRKQKAIEEDNFEEALRVRDALKRLDVQQLQLVQQLASSPPASEVQVPGEADDLQLTSSAQVRQEQSPVKVPSRILQSGPVSSPLLFAATVQTTWTVLEQAGSRTLLAHASLAVGHSQGIAHAVGLPRTCREFGVLPPVIRALFLQGCIEQCRTGLRSVGMTMLRGAPHQMLDPEHGAANECVINSETSTVCSGHIAPQLLRGLAKDKKVMARALPIPFPAHSRELHPSLHQLIEKLRTSALPCDELPDRKLRALAAVRSAGAGKLTLKYGICQGMGKLALDYRHQADDAKASSSSRDAVAASVMPVHPLSGGSRPEGAVWSSVLASQMTDAMDFPASLASASGFLDPSDAMDCGPCRSSVIFRLLEQTSPDFELVRAVADAGSLDQPSDVGGALKSEAEATSLLKRIQDAASDVLGVARVPEDAPLLKAGLTSQSLTSLRSRLLDDIPEAAVILTPAVFFDFPTVSSIASFVAERLSTQPLALADVDRPPVVAFPPISRISVYVSPGQTYPLSFGQEQMLRLQMTNPQMTAYNISSSCWIAGGLNPERLRTCLKRVIARHEVFRTTSVLEPPSAQMRTVEPSVYIIHVENEAAALGRLAEVGQTPFRLGEESSLRAEILVEPKGLILLNLWVHHMNYDIVSQGILLQELHTLLCSPSPSSALLPELAIQYADFAYWSRHCAAQGFYDVTPFMEDLAPHMSLVLELPADLPRPRQWTFRGDCVTTRFAGDLEIPFEGVTPFMVFLAAFFIQLSRSSGQQAVIIGVPYHGRDQADLEFLCGNFVNVVPVVNELTHGTTVEKAVQGIRARWMQVAQHSSVPFLYLLDRLKLERGFRSNPSRNPIFQAMLNYRKDVMKPLREKRFLMQPVHQVHAHMDFDMMVDQVASGETLITHNYCADLFKPRTAERFAGQYLAVLSAISRPWWSSVDVWRLPSTVKAVREVEEAPAMSPERYRDTIGPVLEQLGLLGAKKPIVVDRSSTGAIMVGTG
mmetsp:Transcript_73682/g.134746  ORF Transcript_73682/g.134746 Transcript_73682/m.134746 type:complete len:1005 (-) Transcript_73682:73-3087(-)